MKPIITGTECRIPTAIDQEMFTTEISEDGVIKKYGVETELKIDTLELKFDFWKSIEKLDWKDRDEDRGHKFPSALWEYEEFRDVQREMRHVIDRIKTAFVTADFWNLNNVPEQDRTKILYHIVAKGKHIYDSIIGDTMFAVAFIDQENGFMDFMRKYV